MAEGSSSTTTPTTPQAQEQGFNFLYTHLLLETKWNYLKTTSNLELAGKEFGIRIIGLRRTLKKPGLRKNSPCVPVTNLTECCKKKCVTVFSTAHLQKVRDEFEKLFYENQNVYLSGLLHRKETKKSSGHQRKENPTLSCEGKKVGRPSTEDSRFSFEYTIRNEKGFNTRVCQKAFCVIHGFSPKRLQVLPTKIVEETVECDKRGKHSNHPVVGEEVREKIREHIRSYPSRYSHYSRKDNAERVYLPAELSIARLYRDFLEKHDPEYVRLEGENRQHQIAHQPVQPLRKPLVTEHFYHDIFLTEFNIHFGYPRSDTCGTCDSLNLQIDEATSDSQKLQLEKDLEAHQKIAQEGYDAFRYDRELSKRSWKAAET